ncbi:MAG: hypothetical protein ACYS7Y_33710 [Planctomycetota bacterium]|jgi:hypothetical protein
MNAAAIVHQQVSQLRWHLAACVALIMVLPIEEAFVSLHAGTGFYSAGLAVGVVSFSPLLAGLIACANVQGDLSDKRYIFWRSKPASVKKLMALKFFVGLVLSLFVIACPLIFGVVTSALAGEGLDDPFLKFYLPILILIALMTYSLCFGCNVLVRKTARAWLIGMLLAGFVLVFPFMLPLGITDVVSDVGMWALGAYPAIIIVVSIAAFVCALYAAQHDWHLRTNLKGLLCVAAGLVLLLLMLFSSQVANIRVLDEEVIESFRWGFGTFDSVGNRRIFQGKDYVDVNKKGLSLQNIGSNGGSVVNPPIYGNMGIDSEGNQVVYGPRVKGYMVKTYPGCPNALYMALEDDTYYFGITSYFRQEGEERRKRNIHEAVYLRSYKLIGDSWKVVGELDISDCLTDRKDYIRMAMRLVDKTLVTCVNYSLVTVDVSDPDELKEIDRKLDVIRGGTMWLPDEDRQKEFSIPMLPVEGIGIEERIKLSIDLANRFGHRHDRIYDSSIVDIDDGKIAFFSASERDVARFDVIRWDDEKIYCRFSTARPFTFLEAIARSYGPNNSTFVKDQKLYVKEYEQLMVFDVSSVRRIRKLGHYARMDSGIEDIAILEDGKILISTKSHFASGAKNSADEKRYLYLLENPK